MTRVLIIPLPTLQFLVVVLYQFNLRYHFDPQSSLLSVNRTATRCQSDKGFSLTYS